MARDAGGFACGEDIPRRGRQQAAPGCRAKSNDVVGNSFNENSEDGILAQRAGGNSYSNNKMNYNGDDGMEIDAEGSIFEHNKASRNEG